MPVGIRLWRLLLPARSAAQAWVGAPAAATSKLPDNSVWVTKGMVRKPDAWFVGHGLTGDATRAAYRVAHKAL